MDVINHSVHSRDWYFWCHPSEVVSIVKFTYNVPQSLEIFKQTANSAIANYTDDYKILLIDKTFADASERREMITLQIVYEDGNCEMVHSE